MGGCVFLSAQTEVVPMLFSGINCFLKRISRKHLSCYILSLPKTQVFICILASVCVENKICASIFILLSLRTFSCCHQPASIVADLCLN